MTSAAVKKQKAVTTVSGQEMKQITLTLPMETYSIVQRWQAAFLDREEPRVPTDLEAIRRLVARGLEAEGYIKKGKHA